MTDRWTGDDSWRQGRGARNPPDVGGGGRSNNRGRGPGQGPEPPQTEYGTRSPQPPQGRGAGSRQASFNRGGAPGSPASGGRGGEQAWRSPSGPSIGSPHGGGGGGGGGVGGGGRRQPMSPTSPSTESSRNPGGNRHIDPPPRNELIFAEYTPANIDPRLSDTTQDALVDSFQSLKLSTTFPHRPGWGTAGEPCRYRVNHFPVTFPGTQLFEYRIKIDPRPTITRIRKRVFAILETSPEFVPFKDHIVHDNASRLIASRRLPIPDGGISIIVRHYDEDEAGPTVRSTTHTLTITYITQLDTDSLNSYLAGEPSFRNFDPTPVISALNIILSSHPSKTGILVGRNRFFFPDPSASFRLTCGLEALKGYTSSVRPTFRQMMVNVNICTTAFYKAGNLAESMIEFLDGGGGRLNGFVTGLRVDTLHLGHRNKKTIKRVGELSARQQKFICEEYGNADISVEQYFLRKYEIELRYGAELPVVNVGSNKDKPIWLPAEVCRIIPYQPFRGKIPDRATTEMISYACHYPAYNASKIVDQGLRHLGLQTAKPLEEFGITVGSEMTVVQGRVLPPPQIAYGRGIARIDDKASWNLREVMFIEPKPVRNWMVLCFMDGGTRDFVAPHDPNLVNTLNELTRVCNRSGMSVLMDPFVATVKLPPKDPRDPTRKESIKTIRNKYLGFLSRPNGPKKPDFILILLSNGDKNLFDGVKSLFDLHLDVHTICVHTTKIRRERGQLQFVANIAMKINMKLGGVNHTVDADSLQWLTEEPTMMIGSDVTHPTPESLKGTPSIAAVVGSIDAKFAHYPASMRLQESRKEMITDLAEMMIERLEDYKAKTRRLPKRIIFFRDGVSEGQYKTVVQDELPKIQQACVRMTPGGTYRPKITLVIAGKRHHTRFYPVDGPPNGCDRHGNPRPGTVVDRGVTAIYDHDFYLQAHGGLQGTTRPTHYYVVHDDNHFTADTLQRLINCTSYMFGRATRAVSVVPPAYYADLACDRGRCYIHDLLFASENGTGAAFETEEQVMMEARRLWGDGVGPTVRKNMFYL
ncbi:hypothetical protein FRB98_003417 [Tulasnella sp. 332]|nr:hypothetical protein FRB98_003417 [Tulasnella sp. 332]